MYIYRNAEKKLEAWKKSSQKKPLILRGARQVGKTKLVHHFANTYSQKILLNLEREEDRLLFDTMPIDKLVAYLLLKYNYTPQKPTLIFIDEIQESEKAIAMLRFFYEDYPSLDVIAAGSLLEFALKNIKSFPVGRVHQMALFPISFEEYLEAAQPQLMPYFHQIPVPDIAHPLLLEEFHRYTMIGGMPEVVAQYLQTKDMQSLSAIYSDLWQGYRDDIPKYAKNQTERKVILHILNYAHLEKDRIKYQNFGKSSYKSREVSEAFAALDMSKIIQVIHPTTQLGYPIVPNLKRSPRLQFLDTGILLYLLGVQAEIIRSNDLTAMLQGKIAQHIVSQELIALENSLVYKPHFWVREQDNANAEIDNLLVVNHTVYPIEVKSGKTGRLRSLLQYIDETSSQLAIRLSAAVYSKEQTQTINKRPFELLNIPYYHIAKIRDYLNFCLQ
jgi:hypothetical protein